MFEFGQCLYILMIVFLQIHYWVCQWKNFSKLVNTRWSYEAI